MDPTEIKSGSTHVKQSVVVGVTETGMIVCYDVIKIIAIHIESN